MEPISINCDNCGKINGQEEVGTHWICEDCKVDASHTEENHKN